MNLYLTLIRKEILVFQNRDNILISKTYHPSQKKNILKLSPELSRVPGSDPEYSTV